MEVGSILSPARRKAATIATGEKRHPESTARRPPLQLRSGSGCLYNVSWFDSGVASARPGRCWLFKRSIMFSVDPNDDASRTILFVDLISDPNGWKRKVLVFTH